MGAGIHRYAGLCHCNAIGFEYRTAVPPRDWSVRACQCAFCRAHAALSTSDPGGTLGWNPAGPEYLKRYRFALKTADFLLCRNCGVYIGAEIETRDGRFGIVNTRAFAPMPADIAGAAPIRYDSEDEAERIARREERWTPVVDLPGLRDVAR